MEFTEEIDETYDLIVSNPPFYTAEYKSEKIQRDIARFSDALPFEHLLHSVSKLLSKNGMFSVIIPYKEEEIFLALASKVNLFPHNILHVKGNSTSNIKRSLIVFSFNKMDIKTEGLTIETSRHEYTKNYINLTKDFYLKM
jgi:tRNA1Val (adenine37-N6)-methyltransferase